jgi:AIPR protein
VRLGLGRTRINRDIAATLESAAEHALFPAYHNGLTLLTSKIDNDGDRLVLHGVSVVNGCQSLLALRDAKTKLTDALALVVKIVEVGAEGSLADKITFRSNNQTP